MWNNTPLELMLGLVTVSTRWQSMCNAATPAEARNSIEGFGVSGDDRIEAGWAVAFAKIETDTLRLTGAPTSFTTGGEFLLAFEIPQAGPEGTYGAVMASARDLEDGHMAAWEDMRLLREEVVAASNQPGTFCLRSFDLSEITRSHWTRKAPRWRFHARVTWGPDA